jgi:hypothetical protein
MKLRKPKRRVAIPAKVQAKRLDLNPAQRIVLRRIKEMPSEQVLLMEGMILSLSGTPYALVPRFWSEGVSFYDPRQVAGFLGWSHSTIERYMYCYLRIIRREGEAAKDYRLRKRASNPAEAPLIATINPIGHCAPESHRLMSSRMLLFMVMGPTQVKGKDREFIHQLRKRLTEAAHFSAAKAQRIGPNASVTHFELEPGVETTLDG